jgi:hypothetical protein
MVFDRHFFSEHQKPLLSYINSPISRLIRRGMQIDDVHNPIIKITPKSVHALLPDGQTRTTIYSNPQYAQALHKSYKPIWEAMHFWDMRFANRFMPAYNLGFDTYTSQPDSTAGLDTTISSSTPTTNYGTTALTYIGHAGTNTDRTLIKMDLSSIPSGNVGSAATFSLWLFDDLSSNVRDFRIYRTKRDWVEAQATWNIWKTSNSWSTAGGFHADDCEQTDIGSRSMTATESVGEKQWTMTVSALQEMWNGTFTNNGFLFKADTESSDSYGFRASDYATAGERPKLVITHASASNGSFFFF